MRIRFKATRWQEEDLAKRLGAIISGEAWADYDRSSRKWLLNRGNDYWLHRLDDGNGYLLSVRYWQHREEEIKIGRAHV